MLKCRGLPAIVWMIIFTSVIRRVFTFNQMDAPLFWLRTNAQTWHGRDEQLQWRQRNKSLTNAVLIKCNSLKAVTFEIAFHFCVCLIYSDIGKYSKLFLIIVKVKVHSDLCAPSFKPDILSLTVHCSSEWIHCSKRGHLPSSNTQMTRTRKLYIAVYF